MPAGTYTVTEKNTELVGYTFNEDDSTKSATATVTAGATTVTADSTAELTDEYEKNPTNGPLEIKKTIGGGVTESEVNNGSITFEVTTGTGADKKWLDKDGNLKDKETLITLGAADGFEANENATVWTKTFASVPAGTYTVTEKNKELRGYVFNDEKSVVGGDATLEAGGTETIELEDVYKDFNYYVNKTDASRYNKKVRNSNIAIYEVGKDGSEKEVGRWLSDEGTNNRFNVGRFMMRGGRYIVREEVAPVGFGRVTVDVVLERTGDTPESVKVSVIDEDGKVIDISNGGTYVDAAGDKVSLAADGTVLIEDDHIHFRVNKVDAGNGEELDGAVLILYLADENGVPMKQVDKWTSKAGEIHDFGDKMECGKTYVLRETTAPAGYDKITTDMIIRVSEEGVVSSNLSASVDSDNNVVYLVEDNLKKGASKDTDKSKGVKTGDETPIGEWLAVMAAAMSGLAATIYTRRRREDDIE